MCTHRGGGGRPLGRLRRKVVWLGTCLLPNLCASCAPFADDVLSFSRASLPQRERHAKVDVSSSNVETLIADSKVVSKRPISLIRSDLVYLPGQTVDGSKYISYAMNQGESPSASG